MKRQSMLQGQWRIAAAHRTWVLVAMVGGVWGLRPSGLACHTVLGLLRLKKRGYVVCDR